MKKKWNLLIVTSSLYIGGAEVVIANLCKYLNKDSFNISVCHLKERGMIGEELYNEGYDIVGLPRPKSNKTNYLSFLKLRTIIKEKNIDIIHSHNTYSLVDSSLSKLSLLKIKMVHTFHFGNYPNYTKRYMLLEKLFWRVPDMLVAVGNEQKKVIQKTYKIPGHKVLTIWNGVENRKANVDPLLLQRFSKRGKIIIGSISTFIEQKGLTYLLDVAFTLKKRNKNFLFLLVGDGPLRSELESKCRNLGLTNTVFFLGSVKNAASKVLPLFDIFCQSSLWEAMSIVVLEAMAMGKPLIVNDVGENRHVIDDGKFGYVVAPMNVDNMADALDKLIRKTKLRTKFGLRASKKFQSYFTIERMCKQYEQLYIRVLRE